MLVWMGLAVAGVACGPPIVCAANATNTCHCGAQTGSQVCLPNGEGYTPCNCDGADSGPMGDAAGDAPSPPPDAPPPACGTATTCATCTPMNNCGWCNGRCVAGSASGSSDGACTGASWAYLSTQCAPPPPPPPPMCTHGMENTAATCRDGCDNDGDGFTDCNDFDCCSAVTCGPTTSCARRTMCTGCGTGGTCPTGQVCRYRDCDARAACVFASDPSPVCTTIDGATCPATAAYDRCTADAQCGPGAQCSADYTADGVTTFQSMSWGWRTPRCNHLLGCQGMAGHGCADYGANPCPAAPSGFPGVTAACDAAGSTSGFRTCYGCVLQCTAGAMCPYGLHCAGGRCVD